jgi:hypothetical protein
VAKCKQTCFFFKSLYFAKGKMSLRLKRISSALTLWPCDATLVVLQSDIPCFLMKQWEFPLALLLILMITVPLPSECKRCKVAKLHDKMSSPLPGWWCDWHKHTEGDGRDLLCHSLRSDQTILGRIPWAPIERWRELGFFCPLLCSSGALYFVDSDRLNSLWYWVSGFQIM